MNRGRPESQHRFGGGGPDVAEHGDDDRAPLHAHFQPESKEKTRGKYGTIIVFVDFCRRHKAFWRFFLRLAATKAYDLFEKSG